MPEDVRNWIASAAQVASDSARYYDVDPSTSDAVLAWLEAQPEAPERWEEHAVTIPDDVRDIIRTTLEYYVEYWDENDTSMDNRYSTDTARTPK